MALDIYVMPLWRFKVGDFKSPIEVATGIRPKIITTQGILQRPARVSWTARWRAKRQVSAIRRAVEHVNGVSARWKDEGPVVYSQQSHGMEALKAYAVWLDCRDRFPDFTSPPHGECAKHPIWFVGAEIRSCVQLVSHDCWSGYFLPCDFEQMIETEPYLTPSGGAMFQAVGSSPRLLRELDYVQEHLHVSHDYQYPADDSLSAVKAAYLQLREVAELSCESNLPIIFWG